MCKAPFEKTREIIGRKNKAGKDTHPPALQPHENAPYRLLLRESTLCLSRLA